MYNFVKHENIANWIGNWRDLILHDEIWIDKFGKLFIAKCVVFQMADDKIQKSVYTKYNGWLKMVV